LGKINTRVGDLSNSQGQLINDAKDKAELLHDFFSSVFTRESVDSIPVPAPRSHLITMHRTNGLSG